MGSCCYLSIVTPRHFKNLSQKVLTFDIFYLGGKNVINIYIQHNWVQHSCTMLRLLHRFLLIWHCSPSKWRWSCQNWFFLMTSMCMITILAYLRTSWLLLEHILKLVSSCTHGARGTFVLPETIIFPLRSITFLPDKDFAIRFWWHFFLNPGM